MRAIEDIIRNNAKVVAAMRRPATPEITGKHTHIPLKQAPLEVAPNYNG